MSRTDLIWFMAGVAFICLALYYSAGQRHTQVYLAVPVPLHDEGVKSPGSI